MSALGNHRFTLNNSELEQLSAVFIATHSTAPSLYVNDLGLRIEPISLSVNEGHFKIHHDAVFSPLLSLYQQGDISTLICNCNFDGKALCEYQVLLLKTFLRKPELALFFNRALRVQHLRSAAGKYGLADEDNLDAFFYPEYRNGTVEIVPRSKHLLPVTSDTLLQMQIDLGLQRLGEEIMSEDDKQERIIVLKEHKYYKKLMIELYSAGFSKNGRLKNPLEPIPVDDLLWRAEGNDQLRFYTGIARFQEYSEREATTTDLDALRAIVRNPDELSIFMHDKDLGENISAKSLKPVRVALFRGVPELEVRKIAEFYEIRGYIRLNGQRLGLEALEVRLGYFIDGDDTLYLMDRLKMLNLVLTLNRKQNLLQIHKNQFKVFQQQVLARLEEHAAVDYTYLKPATKKQLREEGFTAAHEKIVYLSDFGRYVMIIPVIRYGEIEIPIRTRRLIYTADSLGTDFLVKRDEDAEESMIRLLLKQHQDFLEQFDNDLHYFYLSKSEFLEEDWFLNSFEVWQREGITVLGFNEIDKQKRNPSKVRIDIKVLSGLDWFNAHIKVSFGSNRVHLKELQKALKRKSKYVALDDGTQGILPAEWISKFSEFFQAGELADAETLLIPKVNYTSIEQLFEEEQLDEEVKQEIATYHRLMEDFRGIEQVDVPEDFKGSLRSYQQSGLNWLNFLDNFNFGGILADDMGLGKTIQVIAFLLSQREKRGFTTSLIVMPATLIFNWQNELAKFAPSMKVLTVYGANRQRLHSEYGDYELVLTSYGTLLADIQQFKKFSFNYIILDESQNIKNPESQRYKAVRLLKSRNKLALSGTPIENNTFDIYGQLSFACPGLLGNKLHFKNTYAIPIDRFGKKSSALALQKKIRPFVLRRTKDDVAKELPEKTEMVLYCPMKDEQRNIYQAYEKEFRDYISATTAEAILKSPMNVLRGLTRLRQICNSPALLEKDGLASRESAKIDMLLKQIEGKIPRHKVLVFSQFVGMLDLIRTELQRRSIRFSYLTGSSVNREKIVNEFQNDPEISVFLMSLKAGGTGLNLTQADYVYLVDPWWNPAVENQAIDRTHRIGQTKKVIAVRLITPDTLEEKMTLMQETKKALAGQLIDTKASFLHSLSKDDLIRLLS